MIVTAEIRNIETGRVYYLTQKEGMVWIGNEAEESMVVSEMQLYQIIDEFFRKEL